MSKWFGLTPEKLDRWRIIPRVLAVLYAIVFTVVVIWFISLKEPSTAQQLFSVAVIGSAAVWLGLLLNKKTKKNENKPRP